MPGWRAPVGCTALLVALLAAMWARFGGGMNTMATATSPKWGTYRPNLYFGLKRRAPTSPLLGLLWYDADGIPWWDHIRHDAEERDGLTRYGWLEHDGDGYGHQELVDPQVGLKLTTTFLREEGSTDTWVARISGQPLEPSIGARNVTVLWYMALPDAEHSMPALPFGRKGVPAREGIEVPLALEDGRGYRMRVLPSPANTYPTVRKVETAAGGKGSTRLDRASFAQVTVDSDQVWNAKEIARGMLGQDANTILKRHQQRQMRNQQAGRQPKPPTRVVSSLPNSPLKGANIVIVQYTFTLPFSFDVAFAPDTIIAAATSDTTEAGVAEKLRVASERFQGRFRDSFPLSGYNASQKAFGRAALSSLLGGIGHYYGSTLVQHPGQEEVETAPVELVSCCPSRSFFPRGFLWDEGFHQLLVGQWDVAISTDILTHWWALVDTDGWLQRELIPGTEARRRVPREFQTQRPNIANPPTLILAVKSLLGKFTRAEQEQKQEVGADSPNESALNGTAAVAVGRDFLRTIFPAMERYVQWFLRTQATPGGDRGRESFRWGGRTPEHCLASGLDDYPRATWVTEREGHVDLHSWLVLMTRTMADLSAFLGETIKAQMYRDRSTRLLGLLDELHWNTDTQTYCDYAYDDQDQRQWVCHEGYITLFPFLLELLAPESPQLAASLCLLQDPTKLWSAFGVLSLARTDPYFGRDENYWRGNIWMPINFLVARALRNYGQSAQPDGKAGVLRCPGSESVGGEGGDGDAAGGKGEGESGERSGMAAQALSASLYGQLRTNLVDNLYQNYEKKGYLFEQYHWRDGEGIRNHAFTGWTALVLLLMSESYD